MPMTRMLPLDWLRALLLTTALTLTGCASLAPPIDTSAGRQMGEPQVRSYHPSIDLGGRLSVRYQQNGNEQAVHGSFAWTQERDRTAVTLLSPLGQTMALIEVTPAGATLTKSGQVVQAASDVNALTANALGWPLPVSRLRDWLQGFAVDASNRRFMAGPNAAMKQVTTSDGWRIHYASWQTDAQSAFPRRIDLERDTEQAGTVAIRIVIDAWQPR